MITLRPHQESNSDKAIVILKHLGLVYLSIEVRCGKTLTALATAKKYGAKKVLFVTKKKAIASIQSDYDLYKPPFEIFVINYESIHKIDFTPDFVVVDEAHSLGAFPKPSNRAKQLVDIVGDLPLILMSGTPSPESFSQLYHQFYISKNSPFKQYRNFYKWAHAFVEIKKRYVYNREMNDYSCAKIEEIEKLTSPYFISLTQKEAGFEQKVVDQVLICDMHPNIEILMNRLKKDLVYEMKNGSSILCDTAVKLQSKFHQISSGTVKDEDGNYHILDNSKSEFIRDYFKGQKIAIFYKFKAEFKLLKETFEHFTDSPEKFQESSDLVFLGQFQSAREGVRLDSADALVFFNIDFSFLSYEQGKNRIMSKERKTKAVLYFVFNRIGIEPKIYKSVSLKSDYTNYHFRRDYNVRKQIEK